MSLLDALILGIVQGLTEFLPVSSSGHLILAETWLKLPVEQLKSFDISLHFGTLLALIVYFFWDFWGLIKGAVMFVVSKFSPKKIVSPEDAKFQKLLGMLFLASLPAVAAGLFLNDWFDENFRNPFTIAIFLIVVGVLFFVAEFIYVRRKNADLNWKQAIIIGLCQALALMPGVSRSGITISSGLFLGVKREEAARFSFLMGSVAIFGGTLFAIVGVLKGKFALPSLDILFTGIVSSFLVSLAAISFLMRYLKNHTLHIFGVYRVIVGFAILYLVEFTLFFAH